MLKEVFLIIFLITRTQETTSGISVISNLVANTYSLVVLITMMVDTASIVVTQPLNAIDLSVSYTNETCREEDGTATVAQVEHQHIYIIGPMTTTNLFLSTRH